MDNKNFLVLGAIMVVAFFGALYLGTSIGTSNQLPAVLIGLGFVGLALILKMGSSLWVLLPLLWAFTGRMLILPVPFSIRNIACLFVVGTMLLMLPLGGFRLKNRFDLLDFLVFIAMAGLVLVYVLNPVGLRALSSGTVGSRPYFEIALAAGAYLVLCNQSMTAQQADMIPKITVILAVLLAAGATFAYLVPTAGLSMYYFYSEWMPNVKSLTNELNIDGVDRKKFLLPLVVPVIVYILAKSRSMIGFFVGGWWHIPALAIAGVGLVLSGFRSIVVQVGMFYIVASYLWTRFRGLFASLLLAGCFIAGVYVASMVVTLPLSAQRALSFLPGEWDHRAKSHAKESSEWRFKMWEDALTTDTVIKNKWVGDGFGYSRREYDVLIDSRYYRGSGITAQEYSTVTGTLHSGPLSTIRYTGVLGLFVYLLIACLVAVRSYRLIRRVESPELKFIAIFFGLQWITHPFYFLFVFGAYDIAMPNMLCAAGLLKMLENSERELEEVKSPTVADSAVGRLPEAAITA